ncbi:MAG: LysR substrate-binding domain-containing protein, partial [Alphaproteobacteria bacterium]
HTKHFASSSAPVLALVEAGNGIGLVDPISAAHYSGEKVIFLPFEPAVSFPIHIIYQEDRRLPSIAESLCDRILSALQQMERTLNR